MRVLIRVLFLSALLTTSPADADTLHLRSGKTLKIDVISCDASACRISIPGGTIELAASEVTKVEADEIVDPEPAPEARDEPTPGSVPSVEESVAQAARRYGLPRSLVRAVARAESSFNPKAVSPKGAQGVMQLMPETAKGLGVRNAFDPVDNIDGGARLLRQLLEKYKGRVAEALAAYNAGEGAVTKYNGVPPYRETRGYIRRVVKDFEKGEKADAAARKP